MKSFLGSHVDPGKDEQLKETKIGEIHTLKQLWSVCILILRRKNRHHVIATAEVVVFIHR